MSVRSLGLRFFIFSFLGGRGEGEREVSRSGTFRGGGAGKNVHADLQCHAIKNKNRNHSTN